MRSNLLILLLAPLLLSSCSQKEEDYESLLTPLFTPEYATGFAIYGLEGRESTIIRVTNPWQGASGVVMDTFVQRNAERPPEGFTGQVVKADPDRLVAMSTTNVGMLEYLGEEKRVVAVSGLQFVFNDYLTDPANGVVDLGEQIEYERLARLQPDLVFCYGVSDAQQMMTDKLSELGIPYIYCGAYLETSALGKSEWLVMYAELLDKREEGIQGFAAIVSDYTACKALTADITPDNRPKVMLNTPYNDAWVLPAKNSVTASLIRNAGGNPFTGKSERGDVTNIGMEEAFTKLREADYWIGLGQMTKHFSDLPEAIRVHSKEIKAVQLDHLYNNNGRLTPGGGSAYYQEGIVRPDLILRDLIEILHPELQEHEIYFYRHVPID
ncbi:MAG: ABC transporter substrate-binding protein [Porphyromonas sp.]|nr:ABC transporter substrate-binding protein [Porphyromonas sp.]